MFENAKQNLRNLGSAWNMEFGFQKLMFLNFLFFSPFLDNDMSHVEIKHVAGDKECAIFVF